MYRYYKIQKGKVNVPNIAVKINFGWANKGKRNCKKKLFLRNNNNNKKL